MTPINKTAAIVKARAGIDNKYEIKNRHLKLNKLLWKNPRLMISPPNYDVTGIKFGRLRVIGYLGKGKWQCKCTCGNYNSRSLKAISNPKNNVDACVECRDLAHIKRKMDYIRTGKDKKVEDYY